MGIHPVEHFRRLWVCHRSPSGLLCTGDIIPVCLDTASEKHWNYSSGNIFSVQVSQYLLCSKMLFFISFVLLLCVCVPTLALTLLNAKSCSFFIIFCLNIYIYTSSFGTSAYGQKQQWCDQRCCSCSSLLTAIPYFCSPWYNRTGWRHKMPSCLLTYLIFVRVVENQFARWWPDFRQLFTYWSRSTVLTICFVDVSMYCEICW